MRFPSPITRPVRPPAKATSSGSPPRPAPPCTVFRAPSRVWRLATTRARLPDWSPTPTSSSRTAKGPTETPRPRKAEGGTRALGWTPTRLGRSFGARPHERAAGPGRGDPSAVHDELTVHGHVGHAVAVLERVLVGRTVLDRVGVEGHEVGLEPRPYDPAVGEAHARRGQRRHLADRFLEGKELLVPDVLAEDPRGRAPGPRV